MSVSLLVPSFRDVGESINRLNSTPVLAERRLLRGGELTFVEDLSLIHSPQTIINLRKGTDPEFPGVPICHCPAPNSVDVYLVASGFNRKWIVSIVKILSDPTYHPPFYLHCAAGKDRTGVMVAAVLSAIRVRRDLIAEDYQLSDGPLYPDLIAAALDEFSAPDYFRKVEVEILKQRFLAT